MRCIYYWNPGTKLSIWHWKGTQSWSVSEWMCGRENNKWSLSSVASILYLVTMVYCSHSILSLVWRRDCLQIVFAINVSCQSLFNGVFMLLKISMTKPRRTFSMLYNKTIWIHVLMRINKAGKAFQRYPIFKIVIFYFHHAINH